MENQNTYFMLNNFFRNHAVYEIKWKNMVEPEGPQITSQYDVYDLYAG